MIIYMNKVEEDIWGMIEREIMAEYEEVISIEQEYFYMIYKSILAKL